MTREMDLMPNLTIRKSDQIMMSLVHYFVTKENYAPIHVQGVKDEIWLENLDGPYRIIRITCNSVINEEQYKFDIFKMKHVMKQIKKKTLSFKVNALNICLDISKKVDKGDVKNIETIGVESLNDVRKNPDINKALEIKIEEPHIGAVPRTVCIFTSFSCIRSSASRRRRGAR